jgi:hypothetical protein
MTLKKFVPIGELGEFRHSTSDSGPEFPGRLSPFEMIWRKQTPVQLEMNIEGL